jgi:hypothetical protein
VLVPLAPLSIFGTFADAIRNRKDRRVYRNDASLRARVIESSDSAAVNVSLKIAW